MKKKVRTREHSKWEQKKKYKEKLKITKEDKT